eukprot:2994964-Rhodomonas_salina.2
MSGTMSSTDLAVRLRACYAMSGTDLVCGTRALEGIETANFEFPLFTRDMRRVKTLLCFQLYHPTRLLRDVRCSRSECCYHVSGTDLGYAATRSTFCSTLPRAEERGVAS